MSMRFRRFLKYLRLTGFQFDSTEYTLDSCAGRVNPHGLRVPAFAGGAVELAAGRDGCGLYLVRVREGAG